MPRRLLFGFEVRAAQSKGENPGSRITFFELDFFSVTGVGARVLLLRRLLLFGGPRCEAAAEGGGPSELPELRRGGCRVLGGERLFVWDGRGLGPGGGGGGIREPPVVDGCRGGAWDGGCDGWAFGAALSRAVGVDCPIPRRNCGMDGIVGLDVSLSPLSRLSVGTARTGGGALEADALGVLWESSSVSIFGVEGPEPCFSCTRSSAVEMVTVASGLGSGGARGRGSVQLRGG